MASWLLGAAKLLFALQTTQAAVVGTVRDGQSGEPLPGATVTLTDAERVVVADAGGRYAFAAVPPGPQHLTVRRIGYTPRTLHALVPRHGELEINVALHAVAILLRGVEVRPRIAVRGVDGEDGPAFPDRGISLAAVRNHPLLAEPDALLALGGGEVRMEPESPSGMHIRGGASDQTAYLLDGIPVFSPYHSAGTFTAWNPDALERLQLHAPTSSPVLPDALSGVVSATTRTPGARFRSQGSVSTTQARATVDGPLGVAGAGYLVSLRTGFPGFIAPEREHSYLRGESGDLLMKLELGALGGRVRLLGYDSSNELDAAASAPDMDADSPDVDARRNAFAWYSRSMGAEWDGQLGGVPVRVRGWRASAEADASWNPDDAPVTMTSEREDDGLLAVAERSTRTTTTAAGMRVRQSRTSYRVAPVNGDAPSVAWSARTLFGTAFVEHERALGSRLAAHVALSATSAAGTVYADPRASLRWTASSRLTLSGSYGRAHQFAQSLRNTESVVGSVFPMDLYVSAGTGGVPVAWSDQAIVAAEYRPADGLRFGAQAYARELGGLLLVAPSTADPFDVSAFTTGTGTARGVAVDAAASGARYGVVASYGWQRVRLVHGHSSYVPDHAASHVAEAGVIVFPSATSSIRLGVTGAMGRRATAVASALEWEACNLLDRGCEFGGSPRLATDRLGATRLPAYLRVDLGVRKHWHLRLGSRDALVAAFGTVTNVFGHRNVLTIATDPATGASAEIGMRPLAPLVVGIDWQF